MGIHVVILGNPIDGFKIIGYFKTDEEAVEWASKYLKYTDWWITPLVHPEHYE